MDTYHGATLQRDNDGTERWCLSGDAADLLKAADEDPESVIWVGTIEELGRALEERYQHESGLSRCLGSNSDVTVYPFPILDVQNEPEYSAVARILAAARVATTIGVLGRIPPGVHDECVYLRGINDILSCAVLRYDPKAAKRRKMAAERRAVNEPISVGAIEAMWHYFRAILVNHLPVSEIVGGRLRTYYIVGLRRALWLVDAVYGKGAFRRLGEWQEFVKNWKAHRKATEDTLLRWGKKAASDTYDPTPQLVAFIEFMRRECRRRLPPVETPEEFDKRAASMDWPK